MRNLVPRLLLLAVLLVLAPVALAPAALAQEASADLAAETAAPTAAPAASGSSVGSVLSPLPGVSLTKGDEDLALPIQLLLLLTVLTLAPSVIILMTSFTRLIVIFSILRTALGMQQSPPTQILIGLALFLTFFIMAPVVEEVNTNALEPYLAEKITQPEALALAAAPTKAFMLEQTRDKDLMLFMDMGGIDAVATPEEVPLHVLVPAFVISELRIAFQIGFMLFLPFLVVDLIVASVLMSMGMMMLPPVMISLPIKLLLFVLTDGWYLIVESVVRGYLG